MSESKFPAGVTNATFKWTITVPPTAVNELYIPGLEKPILPANTRAERRAAEKVLKKLFPGRQLVTVQFRGGHD